MREELILPRSSKSTWTKIRFDQPECRGNNWYRVKKWCETHDSQYRFCMVRTNIWIEDPGDALVFRLWALGLDKN